MLALDEGVFSFDFPHEHQLFVKSQQKFNYVLMEKLASRALAMFSLVDFAERVRLVVQQTPLITQFADHFSKKVKNLVN